MLQQFCWNNFSRLVVVWCIISTADCTRQLYFYPLPCFCWSTRNMNLWQLVSQSATQQPQLGVIVKVTKQYLIFTQYNFRYTIHSKFLHFKQTCITYCQNKRKWIKFFKSSAILLTAEMKGREFVKEMDISAEHIC